MTNDLSNKEVIVHNYIKEVLRNQFPNLDVSDYGAYAEQFIIPHVKLLVPVLEQADRYKLTQSLDNASRLTTVEMDELGSKYFMYREPGEYAKGTVTLSFDDIPANGVIQIRAGTQADSTQGYRFRSVETVSLNEEELANYYDADSFLYRIPVVFESENTGVKYNVNAGEITYILTPIAHLSEVVNEMKFIGGKDQETNEEFAFRIKEQADVPNLGVERGWKKFIKDGFPEVKDVIVAGMGHPLMQRDIIGQVPEGRFSSNVDRNIHWGGKIDLHLRGFKLEETSETKQLTRTLDGELIVPLSNHPTYDIIDIQFTSPRYTDPDLDASFFYVRDFLLLKTEDVETIGTLNENSWVVVKDDRLNEEDTVTVNYRFNKLFTDIETELYTEENRPPASDVLLKEARKKFVHSSMIIRLQNITGIRENDKSVIRQRLFNWISNLGTGEELQFSDFAEPIYNFGSDSVDTKVDYISLPSQFIVTDYDNNLLYYSLNEEKRNFIKLLQDTSLYFKDWIPYFQDNVTIYDFFDVMHLLTFQGIEMDAWKEIEMRDYEWGKKVNYINMAKRMIAYTNSIQRLSPAKWTAAQNEYFQLGDFVIYEDVIYGTSDLERLINLFENIANPNEETPTTDNLLHLVVYCCVLLYVMNTDNLGGMTTTELFNWLLELTKGTPIDYQVNH